MKMNVKIKTISSQFNSMKKKKIEWNVIE